MKMQKPTVVTMSISVCMSKTGCNSISQAQ